MWGKHLIIDMSAGDKDRVRSAEDIRRFVETLVDRKQLRDRARTRSASEKIRHSVANLTAERGQMIQNLLQAQKRF